MYIKNAKLNNFTVFQEVSFNFSTGINIFIGENGSGKTHIMKVLYSACKATESKTSFSNKLVKTMLPDDFKISRLVTRKRGNNTADISVEASSDDEKSKKKLQISFNNKTKKWDAEVKGEEAWEKSFNDTSSIFIPAKEILSHSYKLAAAVDKNNVVFDDTYIDIINSSQIDISVGRNSASKDAMLKRIEQITDGKVVYDERRDEFYLKKGNSKQEFNLVAEGIRKMAMLWQLVKNGTLEKGSVLFWDEPETNINPSYISVIAELLLELSRHSVQIFISTHDYMLAKYFEVRKKNYDKLLFHSLNKENGVVEYEQGERFDQLKHNSIISSFNALLDEIYDCEV